MSTFSRDDLYFRDLRAAGSPWRTLVEGVEANFSVEAWEDRFYLRTDDGAPRSHLLRVDPAAPERRHWTDLFRAVICEVPLLDMVRYHLFSSGRTWVSEYGSAERKEDFGWLYAYSPYHHVKAGTAYPAVLFGSSDSDDRVDPLHARKLAAALQAASAGGPVLLRIEANAGHGGADLVRSTVEEYTDYYAFLIDQLGMAPVTEAPPPSAPTAVPA